MAYPAQLGSMCAGRAAASIHLRRALGLKRGLPFALLAGRQSPAIPALVKYHVAKVQEYGWGGFFPSLIVLSLASLRAPAHFASASYGVPGRQVSAVVIIPGWNTLSYRQANANLQRPGLCIACDRRTWPPPPSEGLATNWRVKQIPSGHAWRMSCFDFPTVNR